MRTRTFLIGRLVLTWTRQWSYAPWIDRCVSVFPDETRAHGFALRLPGRKPRRIDDRWGNRIALVVAWKQRPGTRPPSMGPDQQGAGDGAQANPHMRSMMSSHSSG